MILKLHACLLSLPLWAVNAKRSQVLTASGRRRREARRAKQVHEEEPALAKVDLKDKFGGNDDSCEPHGAGCWTDGNCCEDMECLGIFSWQCGYTPGRVGEYCDFMYACEEDLACYEGVCTDYKDLIDWGEDEGTCATGSDSGELTVMTYNTFLLDASIIGGTFNNPFTDNQWGYGVPSQDHDEREARVARIVAWVQTRPEDVIAVQEMFTFKEDIIAGMVAAGFCHYAATPYGTRGDGTAIFSKHRIVDVDFWDFYDFTGQDSESHPWEAGPVNTAEMAYTDRGVMLAKVAKDENMYNILNTHTMSDSGGDQHLIRMGNFLLLREVADTLPVDEAVFFVGDMNEDKYTYAYGAEEGDQYYQAMLGELHAADPEQKGENRFSYDTRTNPLPALFQDEDFSQLLDYVLYSLNHVEPLSSSCEIIHPLWPADCPNDFECQVSDHYPVTCSFSFVEEVTPVNDDEGDEDDPGSPIGSLCIFDSDCASGNCGYQAWNCPSCCIEGMDYVVQ